MRTVVTEGTAQKAAVSGYDIAAKTGTGEQASEDAAGYKEYSYLSSLVGFAPASDAEVLVYVAFNGTSYLASDSAAPVFSAIMGEALLDMGVKPSS
jgi:cell division protein FtsI (penicillin-binding protein 3)